MNKISWKLTTSINETYNLFLDLDLPYLVETYICQCGHTEFIIKDKHQTIDYSCIECENKSFYDANYYALDYAWSYRKNMKGSWENMMLSDASFDNSKLFEKFPLKFYTTSNESKVSSIYGLEIPVDIDLLRESVIYQNKVIYSVDISNDGTILEHSTMKLKDDVIKTVKNNLLFYMQEHNPFNIRIDIKKITSLERASFFLNNSHLREFDFYYWKSIKQFDDIKLLGIEDALKIVLNGREEKSIKRELYKNYTRQIEYKSFYFGFINTFIKYITDANIVVSFLKLDIPQVDETFDVEEHLIVFLLEQNYSEKQILNLFKQISKESNTYIFKDLLREFSNMLIDTSFFNKVPCSLYALHNEFTACSRRIYLQRIANEKLFYTDLEEKACIKVKEYSVSLPHKGSELLEWSELLSNCLSGYFRRILDKESIVYGFFKDETLRFVAELINNEIVQASSKYNKTLNDEEKEVLKIWFKNYIYDGTDVFKENHYK